MKTYRSLTVLFGIILAAGCQPESKTEENRAAQAQPAIVSNTIEIYEPWIRPGSEGGNSAAYFSVFNGTDTTRALIGVTSTIAGSAEIHESYEDEGRAAMRAAGPLAIAPDSTLQLKPGGYHVMLMQLNRDLAAGDSVRLSLRFKSDSSRTIIVPVKLSD